MNNQSNLILSATIVTALVSPAGAAILQTNDFDEGSFTAFGGNAVSNDLINQGALTLQSYTSSVAQETWPESGVNDGSATAGEAGGDYSWWDLPGTVTLTFELAGSETGYDITSINTIYGYNVADRHAAQNYSIFVNTLADPGYSLLYTVDYDPITTPGVSGSTQVTLTDSTGVLASGVTGIRFVAIDDADGDFTEVGVIQEIDVFGIPTIPEPGSITLIATGGLLLLRRRRG